MAVRRRGPPEGETAVHRRGCAPVQGPRRRCARAADRRADRCDDGAGMGRHAGPATSSTTGPAPVRHRRTTAVYVLEPDDGTLLLSDHLREADRRGDRLLLVACTWAVRGAVGAAQLRDWVRLTGSDEPVVDLGFRRGRLPAAAVTAAARTLDALHGWDTEHHGAYPDAPLGPDHDAVAQGLAAAGVRVVRDHRGPLFVVPPNV